MRLLLLQGHTIPALLGLITLTSLGCNGQLADGSGVPSKGPPDGVAGAGPGQEACTKDVGPTPLARLTSTEYQNTIRELVQLTPDVASIKGADERPGAFTINSQAPLSEPTVDSYRFLAEQIAADAVKQVDVLLGCDPATADEASCVSAFITSFGLRAYRRPLNAEEVARYEALFQLGKASGTLADGVRVVIQGMLQSPFFLYRVESGIVPSLDQAVDLNDYELASRLSYLMRGSLPDAELFAAAALGTLRTPEGLRAQAERLFAAPEAGTAIASFYSQWLHVDDLSALEKKADLFPTFDAARSAMQNETGRFASYVIRQGDGLMSTLFTAPFSLLEAPLFGFYGLTPPANHDPLMPVQLDPSQRAGFLTHPGVLAVAAHADQSSPIFRGIVIRENLLCQTLPSPPPDVVVEPPVPDPTATTRQRFAKHVANPACAGCHDLIDPIGLGFENYDAVGQFRALENGLPIDASGDLRGTDVDGPFNGPIELAQRLAGSEQARQCMMNQWFRYTMARGESERDGCALTKVYQSFAASGFNVRELIMTLVASETFRLRRAH